MIVKLKMHATGKMFGKFVSKTYQGYVILKYVVCNQDRDWVRHDTCCLKQTSLDACS